MAITVSVSASLRHCLSVAALIPLHALTLRSDDGCVPFPEEGIFCGEDPGGFELFWVHDHFIYGETTEYWNGMAGTISSAFNFDRWGHHSSYYIYNLTEGSRLTITGTDYLSHRGVIQGTGSLRILSGSLRFDATNSEVYTTIHGGVTYRSYNTYSGGTEIAGGRLQIQDDASLGSGSLALSGFGILQTQQSGSLRGFSLTGFDTTLQTDADLLVAGVISGDGRLNKTGSGTLTLTAANTHAGGTRIGAGALSVANDANLGAADTGVILSANATLELAEGFASSDRALSLEGPSATVSIAGGTATWNGATAGAGRLVKQGAGALVLAGNVGHANGVAIAAGVLEASVSATLGGSGLASWSGPISGAGALVKSGAGTLELSGVATHSGHTTVRGGTLRAAADDVLSSSSALFLIGGSTLDLAGHDQTVGDLDSYNFATGLNEFATVNLAGATLTNLNRVTNNWAGSLVGNGTLVKQGSATMNWYAANTFAGELRIDAGAVSAQAANVFSDRAAVSLAAGATLRLNDHAQTIAGLSGAGGVSLGAAALTVAQSADATFSGVVSGSGSLVKTGDAALTLSGANTYSGGTLVSAGTLRAGRANAFGSGSVEISGGTLDLGGFAIANSIVNRGGVLAGLANYSGAQTIAGAASFSGLVGGSIAVASAASLDTTGATFTGPITVQTGGALSGTGTLGTLTVEAGGLVSPGNSPGLLTIGDGSILEGTTLIELGGLSRGAGYDAIDVLGPTDGLGSVTVGGTLSMVFWNEWDPSGEAEFRIIRASSIGGTFAQIDLPALSAGFEWRTDRLLSDGYLDIVASAIPEPAAAATFAGLSLLGFAATRRRRAQAPRAHQSL